MAIDTATKRASALGTRRRRLLPIPDGTIDQADRQTLLWCYGGILAAANSQVPKCDVVLYVDMVKNVVLYVDMVKNVVLYGGDRMLKVVIGQDYGISLRSKVDLTDATTLQIRYEKPDGVVGVITATAGGGDNKTATGTITSTINNILGEWSFMVNSVFSGGSTYKTIKDSLECVDEIVEP